MNPKTGSITVCICSSEPLTCQTLKKAVLVWARRRRVKFMVFHDPAGLYRSPDIYDILFLGVHFDGGENGLEAARRLRARGNKAQLIFYTGDASRAPEGFEVGALRYLLKPLQSEKLYEALNAATVALRGRHPGVALRSGGGTVLLPVASISHIESVARRRIVHADGRDVPTWETMQTLFDRLPLGDFAWVQKGVVVNLANVCRLTNNVVTLTGGQKIALSRNYKVDFYALLGRYTGAFPAGPALAAQKQA